MGYLFALIPPFLDSVISYIDKFLLDKYNISATALTIYTGIFSLLSGIVIILFTGVYLTDLKTTLILITSGIFVIFMLITYFKALTLDEASRVASLFQLVPVFVLSLSYIFLHEALSFRQYLGCATIIFACFLFSARSFGRDIIKVNKAFWYMVVTSFLSGSVYVLFKTGVQEIGFWQAIPYESLGSGIAVAFLLVDNVRRKKFIKEARKMSKKVFLFLLISEGIYRLSRLAFYYALLLISASIVSVLQGFQPLFLLIEGIILSVWFPHILKEVVDKKTVGVKLLAVTGVFIGLYLIFI